MISELWTYFVDTHPPCEGNELCPYGGCNEENNDIEKCIPIWESKLDAFDLLLVAYHYIMGYHYLKGA